MSYTIHYYHRKNKKRYTISPLVATIKIDGNVERLYRSCQLSIVAKQGVPYENGERIRVSENGKLLFDGRVFYVEHNSNEGVTLTCYDNAYYFERNTANLVLYPIGSTEKAKGMTLSEIIEMFARRIGVETGFIKPTVKKHGNIGYVATDVQTILQGLLGLERRKTGKAYYLRTEGHKLELRERGGLPGLIIDPGVTMSITRTDDAQNVFTTIYGRGEPEQLETSPGGFGGIASDKYKGADSNGYQSGFKARLKTCDRWDPLIYQVASKNGVDPLLLKVIVMLESSGNPDAISSDGVGSIGLTQITPGNVGVAVDASRLKEPEYNLQKACEAMKGEKYKILKSRSYAPTSKNMAHMWNSWNPAQGENDSPYANTVEMIFRGYGVDANRAFNGDVPVVENEDKATPNTVDQPFQTTVQNKPLREKLGTMQTVMALNAESNGDLAQQLQRIVNGYGENKSLTVEMVGHHNGMSGRRVELLGNEVSGGAWYISSDTHLITAKGHTMSLTLSLTEGYPEPEVPQTPKESLPNVQMDSTAPERAEGKIFIRPADGRYTQSWGIATGENGYTFHNGIDIANDVGTPIRAAASGRVYKTSYSARGLGKSIVIRHFPDGYPDEQGRGGQMWVTVYGHLSEVMVKQGDEVRIGQLIGKMGSTGNSTGSHLHFEIHKGENLYSSSEKMNSVNPIHYY